MKWFFIFWIVIEMIASFYHVFHGDYAHATFFLVWAIIAMEFWRMNSDEHGNPFAQFPPFFQWG